MVASGITFENILTDAGQYVIRFGGSDPSSKIGLANAIQDLDVRRPLTLAERAVAVALAISLDNDYFSRHGGWWYAKRFLHPDIVASYEYIFMWDEDLGVENFNAEEYLKLVKKHGLEISQPTLEPQKGLIWNMTKRRNDSEVHKQAQEKPGKCKYPLLPPCAAFVEIMAPVFSRDAWRCVWHMIQNEFVHGWGLDFAFRKCVEGEAQTGKPAWRAV
ncbi:hypothetical protein KIW84_044897 [Lathyrus oleraceus]|uniref:Phospholipid scramblase n=2 Tax=Pisum sativum TaxID=3888 RepID=A0A9D4XJN4_PEA|nr:hypothetical protein KIW84_044897 [Pisum sativum]